MPTYISLLRYTQKGSESIKESPNRLDSVRQLFRTAGADLKQFYLVTGQYDAVVVADAPNDETLARLMLIIGSAGNVRTETLRAFTEDEFRKIVKSLP